MTSSKREVAGKGAHSDGLAWAMRMSDATWARHASPWSVWTRVPILPALALAVFSRAWIGWWCLVPIALLVVWIWVNPRAFPPPASTDRWASKGTFGERVWLNRAAVPIPAHHERIAALLVRVAGAGMLVVVYGLVALDGWATVAGVAITLLAKMWFCDRMVWLYEDMVDADPTYRSWLR